MPTGNGTDSTTIGPAYLPGIGEIDGRTIPARHFKAIAQDILSDLGGPDHVSAAELELVRRCAGLAVLAAQHEAKILNGEDVPLEAYCTLVNAQGRTLQRIGLKRRQRDVTPTLSEYVKAQDQRGASLDVRRS